MITPDDREIIRRHWKDCPTYLVANQPPCLDLRDQAALPKGRRYEASSFATLAALRPPASWAMGVILCPGDTLEEVAAWALSNKVQDANRILIFHRTDVDLKAALGPWRQAGYGLPMLVEVETWVDMAQILGRHVNNTILRDHTAPGWPT